MHIGREAAMPHPQWYVIQVQTGGEARMADVIVRLCAEADLTADRDEPLLAECFCPSFLTQTKRAGEWQYVERLLLPGYLIAVTAYPDELRDLLRSIPDFTRLLAMGETFVPLREDERAWIEEFTKPSDRTIPMSRGYMRGDTLVATEGPLVGHEGLITRVNRHKSLAILEFHIGGKRITTRVGLGIVGKEKGTAE